MDYFDTHYYQLNRKLLLFIGQWPYQGFGDRLTRRILYFCILMSTTVTQVAKLVTAELNFDLCIEIFSDQLTVLLSCARCSVYTINREQVKALLENMKTNWQSLLNNEENEIFSDIAEEGRIYTLYYTKFICMATGCMIFCAITPSVLEHTILINNSHSRILLYPAEYFVDVQKYYYPILFHMALSFSTMVYGGVVSDLFFTVFMYHIVGMFKITSYRLEHAFDNCHIRSADSSGRTNTCERIVNAVDYHRRAIRFCDNLIAAYNLPNSFTLLFVLLNITASLYWGVKSKGDTGKMIFGLLICLAQMTHMLMLDIPAQMIADHSKEVIDKAYCSFWYNGDVKEQHLLLLTMQRSLKPTYVTLGTVHQMTLENYATEVKAAFSYSTVLMSLT